ncbi:glycosyltransferase [Paenibacillus aceris]|uniref:Glycosyltransferase involved in cell wall biosynthesis n=1 Tax=Paenibacillus aceris TaxID=869555 RepID=A0ABS4I948_9BACL|nr:glycosyltransferase involved in cell wall biosynthesis [Paenibacillus aceris]NHW39364.1 glycosyltransferase [Paenibacillus aceris]
MSQDPLVSIVIPFYNCAYVHQAIESALKQSYPHIEVIVVNDGSSKHLDKINPYLGRIVYLAKRNGGTGSALNAGIRRASGKYFSWLSSDDLYEPDKVARQVAFMQEHGVSVSYGAYYHIDSNNCRVMGGKAGITYPERGQFIKTMLRGCFINGCTVMLNMDVWNEVGLFNESLKYTQDYDMWMRLLHKYDFYYLDEPLVLYRVHPEMGSQKYASSITKEIHQVQYNYRKSLEALIRK